MDGLFADLAPGDRLILGTADSTPPDASLDRLHRIAERVEKEGRLPLKGKALPREAGKRKNEKKSVKRIHAEEKVGADRDILEQIAQKVQEGDSSSVKSLVEQAMTANTSPADILNKGLVAGMEPVGVKFKNNEIFIPEVLIAARAMKAGLELIKPRLKETRAASRGKVIIGTVKGDLHDIGKNIVAVMFEGAGYEVVDLGIDVSKEKFADALKQNTDTVILGISALLTTTMTYMKEIIDEVRVISSSVKVMIGGAPVTQAFADEIKADAYSADAATAVDMAAQLLG
ncbi:MAG: cobalamin-binding protein [Spirochaetales bacterium]|nr:MAG: cobalamin-binding protein [Spirochaetales bacterium]